MLNLDNINKEFMMKLSPGMRGSLLLGSTAAGGARFLRAVKSDIQQKIINNGVPESGFSLAIVPTIRPISPAQVVGHCANDTFKITYTRDSGAVTSPNF
jgi:hypothetical protein